MSRNQRTPANAAEDIAQALEQMVQVLQRQQANQAPRNHVGMNDFLRHNPTKFNGNASPDAADDWICNNEKIFEVIDCSEEQKLIFAVFML
ncbi:hypothetical protein VIGAN_08225000, partial [Vigna angularis var. angularis]